jgi:peptidoglycan hydrolase CwlO-like protein
MNTQVSKTVSMLVLIASSALFSVYASAAPDAFDELEFETGGCDAELNDAKRRVAVCEAKAKKQPQLRKELLTLQSKYGALEYAADNKIASLKQKLRDIQAQIRTERANNKRLRNEIIDLARPR